MRIQEDLIGAERERRGDEKRRAALHAEWAAGRDEDEIKELMEGVKGGFRKRRRAGALDDAVRLNTMKTLRKSWSQQLLSHKLWRRRTPCCPWFPLT